MLATTHFQSIVADPDVWRRWATKPDGMDYYELLLVYMDDILLVNHDPKSTLDNLGKIYALKEGSLGKLDIYLGSQIYEHYLPDG